MTIIRPDSISEDTILRDLRAYLQSRPDADRWRDYFAGGAGATLLELISGLGAFLSYQARATRQESNLLTARLASSIYAAAFTFGYPINRKQSAVLQITGNFTGDYESSRRDFINQYMPYLTSRLPIGTIDGYPVSLPLSYDLESKAPPPATPGNIVLDGLLVGEWEYYVHRVASYTQFYEVPIPLLTNIENIDNVQVHVFINRGGTHVPNTDTITGGDTTELQLTRNTEDMDEETVLIKTLIKGVSIMFGSDAIGYKPQTGDLVLIRYLEIKEPISDSSPEFVVGNLRLEESSLRATSVVVTRKQTAEDSLVKIAKIIPGYFSSKRRMVTDIDHESIVNSMPGIRDSKLIRNECSTKVYEIDNQGACTTADGLWRPPNEVGHDCCTYLMTYLRDDGTKFSNTELEELYARLKEHQIVGENLKFRQASKVHVSLSVDVTIDGTRPFTLISEDIQRVIESQCYKIGGTFRVDKLHSDINEIDGVSSLHMNSPSTDKRLSNNAYFAPPVGWSTLDRNSSSGGGGGGSVGYHSINENLLGASTDLNRLGRGDYYFPPLIPLASGHRITGTVNTEISFQLPEAESSDHLIYSVSGLPSWLSFNPNTRTIHGTAPSTPVIDSANPRIYYRATEKNSGYWNQIKIVVVVTTSS